MRISTAPRAASTHRRRGAVLVAALVAAGALAAVPLAPAQAEDPSDFTSTTLPRVEVDAYPAALLVGPTRGLTYHALTKEGVVAQEFGTAPGVTPDAAMKRRWSMTQPYETSTIDPVQDQGPPAVADVDLDGSVDVAYLVEAGGPKRVVVYGSQDEGFPILAVGTVPTDATGVTITRRVLDTSTGQLSPPLILVAGPSGVTALQYNGSFTLARRPFETSGTTTGLWSFPGQRVLALDHRPTSDLMSLDAGDLLEGDVDRDETAVVLGVGSSLDLYAANFTYASATGRIAPSLGQRLARIASAPAGRQFVTARVRVATTPFAGKNYVVSARDDQPTPRNVVRVHSTRVRALADLSADCQGDDVAGIDVLSTRAFSDRSDVETGAVVAACSVTSGSTLRGGVATSEELFIGEEQTSHEAWASPFDAASGLAGADLGFAQPEIVLPCRSLRAHQPGTSCSSDEQPFGLYELETLGLVGVNTYFSAQAPGTNRIRPHLQSRTWLRRGAYRHGLSPGQNLVYTADITPAGDTGIFGTGGYLVAPLPSVDQAIGVELASLTPRSVTSDRIPRVFLAAPPSVGGSGQRNPPPEFASTTGTTNEGASTMETSLTVELGVEIEDPTGAFGAEASEAVTSALSETASRGLTVTTTDSYVGGVDADGAAVDSVVVDSLRLHRYTGTVTSSSTGLGLGTTTTVDVPMERNTEILAESFLRRKDPAFAEGSGFLDPVLDQVFDHTVGDPGSYRRFEGPVQGARVDDYCDGSYSRTGDRDLADLPDPGVRANPFGVERPTLPGPDVLVGARKTMTPGSGTAERTTIGVTSTSTRSRARSLGLTLSAAAKAAYLKLTATGSATSSETLSTTLSTGVAFQSQVTSPLPAVPGALRGEGYAWRPFMCQKTVATVVGPVTAWVQGYTVDGYAGTGGITDPGPIALTSPAPFATVASLTPPLTWDEPAGDIRTYTWEVRGADAGTSGFSRSGRVHFADLVQARNRPSTTRVEVPTSLPPGHAFTWSVTATDFFGTTRSSGEQLFTTPSLPRANADSFRTREDTTLAGSSVLANDDNARSVTLDLAGQADHGQVGLKVDGTFVYEPDPDYCGPDSFDYQIAETASGTATARIRVRCVNDAPETTRDRLRLPRGRGRLVLAAPGVLGNDTDVEGQRLRARLVSGPATGQVRLRPSGRVVLTAPARRPRRTSWTYEACDGPGACSAPQRVTVRLR